MGTCIRREGEAHRAEILTEGDLTTFRTYVRRYDGRVRMRNNARDNNSVILDHSTFIHTRAMDAGLLAKCSVISVELGAAYLARQRTQQTQRKSVRLGAKRGCGLAQKNVRRLIHSYIQSVIRLSICEGVRE